MVGYLIRRFRKSERGAALIEFAIVIPVFLLLVLGIIEFGWLFNGWITLTGAAREGARYAVVGKEDQIETAVKRHIDHLQINGLSILPAIGNPGQETSVTISGSMPLLVGFFPISNPFPISAKATMRQEY